MCNGHYQIIPPMYEKFIIKKLKIKRKLVYVPMASQKVDKTKTKAQ